MKDFILSEPVTILSGDTMFGGVQKPVQAQDCAVTAVSVNGNTLQVTATPPGLFTQPIALDKAPEIAAIVAMLEDAVAAHIEKVLVSHA